MCAGVASRRDARRKPGTVVRLPAGNASDKLGRDQGEDEDVRDGEDKHDRSADHARVFGAPRCSAVARRAWDRSQLGSGRNARLLE